MHRIIAAMCVLFLMAGGGAAAADYVSGTVLFTDGDLKYARVSVGDSYSDGYISYYSGRVGGYDDYLLFDPYNRIWIAQPISYRPASLKFGGKSLKGWKRQFGDGTEDSRFFFGKDGHVYQRVDVYRDYDEGKHKGKGRGKGKGHDQSKKQKTYSFWVDLADQRRDGPVYIVTGASSPSASELDSWCHNLYGYSYGNWRDGVLIRPRTFDPIGEEDRLSIGISISFNL